MGDSPGVAANQADSTRVRDTCRSCGRVSTTHSRKGIYWKCPCGQLNPGPAMVQALAAVGTPGQRRRIARREAAAAAKAAAATPESTPAPAGAARPVRRVTRAATVSAQPATGPAAAATPPTPAPTPRQAWTFRRILGYDDEDEEAVG